MMCPNCGSTCEIKTERRPDGDSECGYCGHKAKTVAFQRIERVDQQNEALRLSMEFTKEEHAKEMEKAAAAIERKDREISALEQKLLGAYDAGVRFGRIQAMEESK